MSVFKKVVLEPFALSYQTFGTGDETVLCLHGHGRSSSDFLFLQDANVKVVSIDLFFHGESVIPENRIDKNPVSWADIAPVFEQLFQQENIDRCHFLAFSQGGRFALLMLQHFTDRVQTFTLLAPDGMDNRSFYNWSSRQGFFRKLFHYWKKKPEKLQKLADVALKVKLMRPKVRDFVYHFSSNPDTMLRASKTWMAFRKLQPDPVLIGLKVKQYHLPFRIIMGKYDQVIRPQQALLFLRRAGLPQEIIEIENGHDFFKPSSIDKFRGFLPF
jgi:pimeloyl-ACP methyl ester carboxylesterase